MSRPAPASDVRTHRMMFPNRRPLLISAVLVALTSIPTMIVVLAGSASLERGDRVRPPAVARPTEGPFVVEPDASSAVNEPPTVSRHSILAMPTAERPAPTRGSGGAVAGPAGGSGGGSSLGTGAGPVVKPTAPKSNGPTPRVPAAPTVRPAPTDRPAPDGDPEPAGDPRPTGDPRRDHGPGDGGSRIDDNAWPGWDSGMKGRSESAPPPRKGRPDPGRVAEPVDRRGRTTAGKGGSGRFGRVDVRTRPRIRISVPRGCWSCG